MNINISIVIAHYLPENNIHKNPLEKTISIIENEPDSHKAEIIIADDGSNYSQDIVSSYSKKINYNDRYIYVLEGDKLKSFLLKINLSSNCIKKWIYLPKDQPCMSKARVVNYGAKIAQSNKLVFLDDDNYFISKDSLNNVLTLFNNYNFIVGQIKDNNGRLRLYNSKRVQGTTIAVEKNIFNQVDGFGEWTEEFSCGVDSDFWINIFASFNSKKNIKACYTDKFSTYDSYSKRWKKYTRFFRDIYLKREFNRRYKCKNYKSAKYNLSRNKNLWIDNLIEE